MTRIFSLSQRVFFCVFFFLRVFVPACYQESLCTQTIYRFHIYVNTANFFLLLLSFGMCCTTILFEIAMIMFYLYVLFFFFIFYFTSPKMHVAFKFERVNVRIENRPNIVWGQPNNSQYLKYLDICLDKSLVCMHLSLTRRPPSKIERETNKPTNKTTDERCSFNRISKFEWIWNDYDLCTLRKLQFFFSRCEMHTNEIFARE